MSPTRGGANLHPLYYCRDFTNSEAKFSTGKFMSRRLLLVIVVVLCAVLLAACGDSADNSAQNADLPTQTATSAAVTVPTPTLASQPESPLANFDSPLAAPESPLGVPQPEALPAEYGCNLDFSAPSSDSGTVCGMVISETPATKYLLAGDFYLAPVIYSKAKLEDGSEIDIPFVSLNVGSDKVADIKTESGGFVFLDVPPGEYGVVIYTPVQSFLFHDGAGQQTLMFEIAGGEVKRLDPISLD